MWLFGVLVMYLMIHSEGTQLWFQLHGCVLWRNMLSSFWMQKEWQVFRQSSKSLPHSWRLYNQILCVFHVARAKYKQQSEINSSSYIKGGWELPDFAELLQQKQQGIFWGGDEDEVQIGSKLNACSRWNSGQSSNFSAQLGCDWRAGRERQPSCLSAGGHRPVGHCTFTHFWRNLRQ